ncbi:MAG: 16S rRNA (adenine(1518)-N(6)/adenine(1519)-N(6))-dimethyltransferase RsmA [Clostridiales bacterium]|nr:16S rRNA (adenine(1518)-N(6)/adenine(1519)-N(6))-dimethyltransferase RsmA [Clostridiales bacterium]
MNLTGKEQLTKLLGKYGFSFSKGLGQNFLIDRNVLENIVVSSDINKDTNVIEIGPGAGTLTKELCLNAKKVVSIEIDKNLEPVLNEVLSGFENFKLIMQDIMKADIKKIVSDEFSDEPFVVVANLPYYITTPIVMKFLEEDLPVKSLTLMIQKEVAQRMTAKAGNKEYGALSVAVRFYSEPKIICAASPHCFVPQPKVTSTVIKLSVYEQPPLNPKNKDFFFKVVKSLFSQRRKTLVNSLSKSPYINLSKDDIIWALNEMNTDTNIRGEKLEIDKLVEFSDILYTKYNK